MFKGSKNCQSPYKSAAKKRSSKRQRTCSDAFQSDDANMAYNDYYKKASIILERIVELESLEHTFIPEVFKERKWTKLLSPMGNVHTEIIREFFSNAMVEGDCIGYWLREGEFYVTRDSIQEILEIHPMTSYTSL